MHPATIPPLVTQTDGNASQTQHEAALNMPPPSFAATGTDKWPQRVNLQNARCASVTARPPVHSRLFEPLTCRRRRQQRISAQCRQLSDSKVRIRCSASHGSGNVRLTSARTFRSRGAGQNSDDDASVTLCIARRPNGSSFEARSLASCMWIVCRMTYST